MRIVVVSSELPPGPGGIGNHAHGLANKLASRAHEIVVYAPIRSGFQKLSAEKTLYEFHGYPLSWKPLRRLCFMFWSIRSMKPEVDWLIFTGLSSQIIGFLLSLVVGGKYMSILHGHEILMASGFRRRVLTKFILKVESVVAVSNYAASLLKMKGIQRPIHVIPNGINTEGALLNKAKPGSSLRLITVGSITPRKGQLNVVQCLPDLCEKFGHVEYHMVGMLNEASAVESSARRLGVTACLFIHGVVGDEERDRLVRDADIFIMLSERQPNGDVEGFGIAILEANSLGLPAIGSKGTGIEDAINNGFSGFLVDPHNSTEITERILDILDNYSTMSANAISWAKDHDWDIVCSKYESCFK